VSLDSPDPAEHDKHRGIKGAYDGVIQAIEACKAEGFKVNLSYFATRENLSNGKLKKAIDLGRKLDVNGVRVLQPILCGRLKDAHDMQFTPKEEEKLLDLLDPGFAFLERNDIREDQRCPSFNKEYIYISCYGEVQPCCYVPLMFGSVRDEPLERILTRMWNHEMFRGENTQCLGCSHSLYARTAEQKEEKKSEPSVTECCRERVKVET
jgi:MoaA/NifB/PqqE/SkfB family radical SAM enzyme